MVRFYKLQERVVYYFQELIWEILPDLATQLSSRQKQKKINQIALFKQVTLSSRHLYRLLYRRDERNDVPRPLNRRTRSATFTFATLDLQVCAGLCRQITFVAKLTRMKANKRVK